MLCVPTYHAHNHPISDYYFYAPAYYNILQSTYSVVRLRQTTTEKPTRVLNYIITLFDLRAAYQVSVYTWIQAYVCMCTTRIRLVCRRRVKLIGEKIIVLKNKIKSKFHAWVVSHVATMWTAATIFSSSLTQTHTHTHVPAIIYNTRIIS